jgi:hypothetical protein
VISSTLVERLHPRFGVFPGALHGEFGSSATTFDEEAFLAFVTRTKRTGLELGGAYMPSLFHRDVAIEAGLYPCGNVAGGSFEEVARYGDEAFFDRLDSLGVKHFTALDSISYHLKEGERADNADSVAGQTEAPGLTDVTQSAHTPVCAFPPQPAIERVRDSMAPSKRHTALMALVTVEIGAAPETRTLRQLVASGLLTPEEEKRAKADIADPGQARRAEEEEQALQAQGRMIRSYVERVVGERRAEAAMDVIHSASWVTRPVRRALLRLRRRR